MASFISNVIASSVAKTGGYVIRQSFKNNQRKNDNNQDIDDSQINTEIENAKKVTKEAEYYLNWLEKGIDLRKLIIALSTDLKSKEDMLVNVSHSG